MMSLSVLHRDHSALAVRGGQILLQRLLIRLIVRAECKRLLFRFNCLFRLSGREIRCGQRVEVIRIISGGDGLGRKSDGLLGISDAANSWK